MTAITHHLLTSLKHFGTCRGLLFVGCIDTNHHDKQDLLTAGKGLMETHLEQLITNQLVLVGTFAKFERDYYVRRRRSDLGFATIFTHYSKNLGELVNSDPDCFRNRTMTRSAVLDFDVCSDYACQLGTFFQNSCEHGSVCNAQKAASVVSLVAHWPAKQRVTGSISSRARQQCGGQHCSPALSSVRDLEPWTPCVEIVHYISEPKSFTEIMGEIRHSATLRCHATVLPCGVTRSYTCFVTLTRNQPIDAKMLAVLSLDCWEA